VPLLAMDHEIGDHDVIVFRLHSRRAGLVMPHILAGLALTATMQPAKSLSPSARIADNSP